MPDETATHTRDRYKETKIMRKLLLAVPAAAVLGLSSLALAGPAFAYGPLGGNAIITASAQNLPGGTVDISVQGGPFGCDETVNLYMGSPSAYLGSTTSSCNNGSGTIDATFQLPSGYPAGNHTVAALGVTSGDTGSANVTTTEESGGSSPCTSSYTSHAHAIVLAAAIETSCLNAVPPAVAQPGSAGSAPAVAGSPKSGAVPMAAGSPEAAGTGSSSGLPLTGADVVGITTGGAGAVLIGGLLVLASRRRRASRF